MSESSGPPPADSSVGYVATIHLPGCPPSDVMRLAYPHPGDPHGCVNIICGQNNTGKSYLLDGVRRALIGRWDGGPTFTQDLRLTVSGPLAPSIVLLGRVWKDQDAVGHMNVLMDEKRLGLPGHRPDFRRALLRILHRQLVEHIDPSVLGTEEEWCSQRDRRKTVLECLPGETRLYRCDRGDALIARLERLLEGTLYIRREAATAGHSAGHLEFVIARNDGSTVPYDRWSDGQKALFYLATVLHEQRANVILLEEIENHLHPGYMSRALELLKEVHAQSLVTSHHPHAIFSNYADEVFFLEASGRDRLVDPPATLEHRKRVEWVSPKRRVLTLRDNFERVTSAYSLFDDIDSELLRQAGWIAERAELELYRAVCLSFDDPPRPPTSRMFPDKQTLQLDAVLRDLKFLERPSCRILDIGAGIGRMPAEFSKLYRNKGERVEWICWDPDPVARATLRAQVAAGNMHVTVIDALDEAVDPQVDLCLVANVLHHMVPEHCASLLATTYERLRAVNGALIILELYPLMRPEQFAVAYPPSLLHELLAECGFLAHVFAMPVHPGIVSANCIVARPDSTAAPLTYDGALAVVVRAWERLEATTLNSYASRLGVSSVAGHKGLLSDLATIASIRTWQLRRRWPH